MKTGLVVRAVALAATCSMLGCSTDSSKEDSYDNVAPTLEIATWSVTGMADEQTAILRGVHEGDGAICIWIRAVGAGQMDGTVRATPNADDRASCAFPDEIMPLRVLVSNASPSNEVVIVGVVSDAVRRVEYVVEGGSVGVAEIRDRVVTLRRSANTVLTAITVQFASGESVACLVDRGEVVDCSP